TRQPRRLETEEDREGTPHDNGSDARQAWQMGPEQPTCTILVSGAIQMGPQSERSSDPGSDVGGHCRERARAAGSVHVERVLPASALGSILPPTAKRTEYAALRSPCL